jgi:signal transduction histidine kinase
MPDSASKINVLYLDDEQHNLNSFKAMLRMDYNIFIVHTAEAAELILQQNPNIQVVISDQKMPGKTGVAFLKDVRLKYPLSVRMLLTAYTDTEDMMQAINEGNIFRYITKPWLEHEIRAAIEEAYLYYTSNSLLKVKNEELQEAYDELDSFSYTVAHDIRGPILSVLSSIEMLRSMDDPGETARFLTILEKTMVNLNLFIVNTHSYHRLRRGALAIEDIDFNKLVSGIAEISEMERRLNNIEFDININQQQSFRSDKILLSLIIDNIVSNAFKYKQLSKNHKVTLDIDIFNNAATIIVRDNGIGINSDHLEKIFDLFYRGETMAPGSGYGLYNVSKAVKKLKGTIEVRSSLNVGSEFKIIIPSE